MTKPQIKEYNCETGEEIVRDATAAEIAQIKKDADEFARIKAEAEAKAAKARADTVLTVAQAEKTRAQTAETLAGIDRDDREELMKVADALRQPSEQNPAPTQPV